MSERIFRRAKIGSAAAFLKEKVLLHKCSKECLLWPFSRLSDGRAVIWIDGQNRIAARIVCLSVHGDPPSEEHHAAHNCGNGHLGCVNPTHIRWATPTENQADRVVHGTDSRGEKSANAKLASHEVSEIRRMKGSMSQRELSRMFGISQTTVGSILRGETWKHI